MMRLLMVVSASLHSKNHRQRFSQVGFYGVGNNQNKLRLVLFIFVIFLIFVNFKLCLCLIWGLFFCLCLVSTTGGPQVTTVILSAPVWFRELSPESTGYNETGKFFLFDLFEWGFWIRVLFVVLLGVFGRNYYSCLVGGVITKLGLLLGNFQFPK